MEMSVKMTGAYVDNFVVDLVEIRVVATVMRA